MNNTQEPKPKTKAERKAIASLIIGIILFVIMRGIYPYLISMSSPSLLGYSTLISIINFALYKTGMAGIFTISIPLFTVIAGLIGLILGISGLKSSKRIFAIIGVVLCIIGILLAFYYYFALIFISGTH